MTLSLYRTYNAWRHDVAAEGAARASQASHPIQSSVYYALVLFGLGVEGMSCGGDMPTPGNH